MLFDPNWEAGSKAKSQPRTLEHFIGWLEKQPPKTTYDFMDECGNCLLGQYMKHIGEPWSMEHYRTILRELYGNRRQNYFLCKGEPTVGAALERARELAA